MNNDTTVNVKIVGTNDTKSAVEEANNGFAGLWKQVAGGTIAAQLAQDGIQALKSAFSTVKSAAEEWQNQQVALDAALQSTHDVSGLTHGDAVKYAEALSKSTPISRESALAGENMLLTFTNIHKDVFPQTTKAIADMATAMNHGLTPSAQDLSSTAIMVGKAMNDPENGLTRLMRVGVQFTQQQKDQIKTLQDSGDMTGAQTIILKELSTEFGGRATASAHTFQGAMTMLKNQAVDKLADAFTVVMRGLNAFTSFLETHKIAMAAFAGVIGGLAIAIGVALAPVVWGAVTAFGALVIAAGPFILIGAAIGVLAYEIVTHWQTLKQWFMDLWGWIKDNWPLLLGILLGPFGYAVGWIIQHWREVLDFMKDIPGKVKDAISAVGDAILAPFKYAFNEIARLWDDTVGKISFKAPSWVPGIGGRGWSMPQIPLLAQGTDNWMGGYALVGEQGPELINLPKGSQVIPAQQTSSMLNSNNKSNVTIHNLILPTNEAVQSFFTKIDRDNLLTGKGMSAVRGSQ